MGMEKLLDRTSSVRTIDELIVVLTFLQNARVQATNNFVERDFGGYWPAVTIYDAQRKVLREFCKPDVGGMV